MKKITTKQWKIIAIGAAGVFLVALVFVIDVLTQKPNMGKVVFENTPITVPFTHFSQLDGSGVTSTEAEMPRVITVMIDNHPDALPQSGIAEARVVYEAPVEGGLSRYMVLFNASSSVSEVGPVRSARPYFLDWVDEYGSAPYMHSGGSPDALALLKKSDMFDVNEFWWGQYYWRDVKRPAPHNLYTNSNRWQNLLLNEEYKHLNNTWLGWKFSDVVPTSSVGATAIEFKYNSQYKVGWKYDSVVSRYLRLINDSPLMDSSNRNILADNILIQFVNVKVLDEEGRRQIDTIGTGEARVLRNEVLVHGTWKKNSKTDRTRFYDESGNEVSLTPGQTWVEVVPIETELQVTN